MKKFLAAILVAIMVCSMAALPASATFQDITNSNTEEAVAVLQMLGVINGLPNGTFNPNGTLTRAQFCKMAIVSMKKEDSVPLYKNRTIFPDAPGSHWAAGYINMAASAPASDSGDSTTTSRIIAGYPDGTFRPETNINFAQAVTILMRVLGYTDSDVGMIWPSGYLNTAAAIGLTDGLNLSADSDITREQAALLFYNLLGTHAKGGEAPYISKISSNVVDNVILISNNATASDGTTGSVQVAGGTEAIYKVVNQAPESLIGCRGSLALDAKGRAITFLPASDMSQKSFTVSTAAGTYITCADGTKLEFSNSIPAYIDGKSKAYSALWMDLAVGTSGTAYYAASGTMEYLVFNTAAADLSGATVLTSGSLSTTALIGRYSLPAGNYKIVKNNAEASSSDLRQYDVVTYNADAKTFNVSDFRLTGIYENAYPNTDTPSKISMLGCEFSVLPGAISDLSKFKIGQSVTLLLTASNKVAGAVSPNTLPADVIGLVKSASTSKTEVTLFNGITISGKLSITDYAANQYSGQLVKVSSYKVGYISLFKITESGSTASLDLVNKKLGTASLSGSIKMFERVGNSEVVQITYDDLLQTRISSSSINFAGYDYAGRVNYLLLNDVTGDRYTYGFYKYTPGEPGVGMDPGTNATVSVDTLGGASDALICGRLFTTGEPGGIAGTVDGKLAGSVSLTAIKSVKRSAFVTDSAGKVTVTADGMTFRVANNVPCYLKTTDLWGTLIRAREFSDSLTIYYDRAPSEGGKVRLVVAN